MAMGIDPVASRRIFLGMLALITGGAVAAELLRAPASPPRRRLPVIRSWWKGARSTWRVA
jgi:hypothetical protein